MAPVSEGKSIGSDQKTVLKGELLIWRTKKNEARDQGTLVQLKEGFSLLQISPNWFLGNWIQDPGLKWALVIRALVVGATLGCPKKITYHFESTFLWGRFDQEVLRHLGS
jgi:hypothetical protein